MCIKWENNGTLSNESYKRHTTRNHHALHCDWDVRIKTTDQEEKINRK